MFERVESSSCHDSFSVVNGVGGEKGESMLKKRDSCTALKEYTVQVGKNLLNNLT
jgi:hypothetical protein